MVNKVILLLIAVAIITCSILSFLGQYIIKTKFGNTQPVNTARPSDFPQYVGRDGKEALFDFTSEYPEYRIEIVGPDSLVTTDYDQNRVRMYVNRAGKIIKMRIG